MQGISSQILDKIENIINNDKACRFMKSEFQDKYNFHEIEEGQNSFNWLNPSENIRNL